MMMKTMTRMTRTARNYHSKGLQRLRQTETLTLQYTIAEVEEEDVGSQTADDDTRGEDERPTHHRGPRAEAIAHGCSHGTCHTALINVKNLLT